MTKQKKHLSYILKTVFLGLLFLLCQTTCSCHKQIDSWRQSLEVVSTNRSSQIEVGGPFVGIEMHQSSPLLNRISFFYPVANSIDLSTDYWQREKDRVLFIGLKIEDQPKQWLKPQPIRYQLTPYAVTFSNSDPEKELEINYQFCRNKPAMVARITVANNSPQAQQFEVYTHLELSLRTSHTYAIKDQAWTSFDKTGSDIYAQFDDPETGNVQIFVANAGQLPQSFATNGQILGLPDKGENWWMIKSSVLPAETTAPKMVHRPVAAYVYAKDLAPGQKLTIVQLIGSGKAGESKQLVANLLEHYAEETNLYEQSVLESAYQDARIETGESSLDHSAGWAKSILATNAHYLDGEVVPMPCPAEYNFFFTHDVLLTDLAAVHFDLARVKKDLQYVARHAAADSIIPHAYYWKDDRYATEYATPDNWNHFWFIQLAASYLRHSNDLQTVQAIYPLLTKSLQQTLINKKADDLMWAYRPDWWDIGSSFGPRSYMTILAIRALRDFTYLATRLGQNLSDLLAYEQLAARMQSQLSEKLWDNQLNYLINYFEDGTEDRHFYIGSLLAAHFNLLDENKLNDLVQSAGKYLLDPRLGIYNVYPMDFHQLIAYLKLNGNEAGAPFTYANGGIWPHGNAWYALALISLDKKDEAFQFIRKTMTLAGIVNSPNGQPAMYEYRNSNAQNSSAYGKIDKPQFLWAAGWYLYSLYHLLGIRENEWNISLDPYLIAPDRPTKFKLAEAGKLVTVTTAGKGDLISQIKCDGQLYPSAVLLENTPGKKIEILLGKPEMPLISKTNAILLAARFVAKEKRLTINLQAFAGHQNQTQIISPWPAIAIQVNGLYLKEDWQVTKQKNYYQIELHFSHHTNGDEVEIQF